MYSQLQLNCKLVLLVGTGCLVLVLAFGWFGSDLSIQ